ncbi:hypothetical protein TWF694_003096 [Orbilia ellipsospora]|uniref:Uncharacterized protein n=1 Tax=Orbilia ellipsospora TaxID=2528407 RepID=A0AAV9X1S5_9PEZI
MQDLFASPRIRRWVPEETLATSPEVILERGNGRLCLVKSLARAPLSVIDNTTSWDLDSKGGTFRDDITGAQLINPRKKKEEGRRKKAGVGVSGNRKYWFNLRQSISDSMTPLMLYHVDMLAGLLPSFEMVCRLNSHL